MKISQLAKSVAIVSLSTAIYTTAYADNMNSQEAFANLSTSAITKLKDSKIDINALLSNASNDLIINFNETSHKVDDSDHTNKKVATRTFKAVKDSVYSELTDTTILRDYYGAPTSFYRITSREDLIKLLNSPDVVSVTSNLTMTSFDRSALDLIDQPEAARESVRTYNGYNHYFRGEGSVIAVLDSGLNYRHSDFGSCSYRLNTSNCSVVDVIDFARENNGSYDGQLDDSPNIHGTNVSAIALSVAPEAKVLGMDVFKWQNNRFIVQTYDINAALNWLQNNHISNNRNGLNVVSINMSLGWSTRERSPTYQMPMIGRLKRLGAATVVATGNDYATDSIGWPASEADAIAVGAVHDSNSYRSERCGNYGYIYGHSADDVVCFSNSGRLLDFLAPGYNVTGGGTTLSGTSMATPHVAGAYAVLRAPAIIDLTRDSVDDTTRRFERSGVPVTDFRNGITRPRIDLLQAVRTVN